MVALMAKQPKAEARAFGERKEQRFQVIFTTTGLTQLDEMAAEMGLSRSDLIEKMARALYATEKPLRESFLARSVVE